MATEAGETARKATPWRSWWWIAAATFIGGVIIGVLLVGLLRAGTPDFVSASREAARNAPTPPGQAGIPVAAQAEVNAACLQAINGAQDVTRILSGVDDAADDVDLQRLDDIVRQLQPLEQRLRQDLATCRVNAVSVQEPTPGSRPPTPAASPTEPSPTELSPSEPGSPEPTSGPS